MIIVIPTWHSQPQYQILLEITIKNPVLLATHPKALLSPEGKCPNSERVTETGDIVDN